MREQALRQLGIAGGTKEKEKRRSKYGAKRILYDGLYFDSKREARRYAYHKLRMGAGEIKCFHRQVIFDLPGNVKYICDFLVRTNDDEWIYEDSKGVRTKEFRIKQRQVKAIYGVEIVLV
jgi:hypothetical protein